MVDIGLWIEVAIAGTKCEAGGRTGKTRSCRVASSLFPGVSSFLAPDPNDPRYPSDIPAKTQRLLPLGL